MKEKNRNFGESLVGKQELTRLEFGIMIQKSLMAMFEGCHKDAMKSTLAIRAILYEVSLNYL